MRARGGSDSVRSQIVGKVRHRVTNQRYPLKLALSRRKSLMFLQTFDLAGCDMVPVHPATVCPCGVS